MNRAEMAEATELSEAMISRLASGERNPSFETMAKIRRVLGWSIERQVDELRRGNYAAEFKLRMERRPARARS
jgi:transcriptional regulator with XRE-family HTH domain